MTTLIPKSIALSNQPRNTTSGSLCTCWMKFSVICLIESAGRILGAGVSIFKSILVYNFVVYLYVSACKGTKKNVYVQEKFTFVDIGYIF